MLDLLRDPKRLTGYLRGFAKQRRCLPQDPPRWVQKLLDSEGLTRSLAGLLCNATKQNRFYFRPPKGRLITRRSWEAGSPEHASWAYFKELDEEEQREFRIAFRLSLPDMLLHSIVGKFLTAKLEGLVSDGCYGYRPGNGQAAAVKAVRQWCQEQGAWIVKLDVSRFNETVDHSVLRRLLEENLCPLLKPDDNRIVLGTTDALLKASYQATEQSGKGLLVGSGLTPPLTNLYLSPLDKYLDSQQLRFARYGDDLVVRCDSKNEAQTVIQKLTDILFELKQEPNTDSAFELSRCWIRGLRLRWRTEDDAVALLQAKEREKKLKTDVYGPGEPFDFVGFEFDGPRVSIRQETLAKAKRRLEQYTQRSARIICKARKRGDAIMGQMVRDSDAGYSSDRAVVSVQYVRNAIRRINLFLGFKTSLSPLEPRCKKVSFRPGYGFPWSVLNCVDYADVREQFAILDGYAFNRLKRLQVSVLGAGAAELGPLSDFSNFSLRAEGLMTCKDVANRFPAANDSGSAEPPAVFDCG
jgi:hypothetical protein